MIILRKSQEQEMFDEFLLEYKDMEKLLKHPLSHIRERASSRMKVLDASIEELKKQIANPQRHSMLQEGVNPDET
jgi:hypothetical protein